MQRRILLALGAAALTAAGVLSQRIADRAAAQEKPQPAARQPSPVSEMEQHDDAARVKLSQRIPLEFVESPLGDVVEFLSDALDLEFYANWKKVEAAGIARDVPVTLKLTRVSGGMALELALDQAGPDQLAYVIRDGVVIISTVDDLDGAATLHVYNCRDLLVPSQSSIGTSGMMGPGMGSGGYGEAATPGPGGSPYGASGMAGMSSMSGGAGMGMMMGSSEGMAGPAGYGGPPTTSVAAERLVNILTSSIVPNTWQAAGGTGTIAEYNGLIVVNHNARVHAQVEQLLKMLREAAQEK